MRPVKLDARVDAAEAARYKLVRTDSYADIAGDIVWADEASGSYAVRGRDSTVSEHCLGVGGLRIVPRR
ncbi:MAG TPA: hypothetical protein VGR91_17260 [Stellaceae bacterium]|nr:hypothetical protein [Stellaceae bacterium]